MQQNDSLADGNNLRTALFPTIEFAVEGQTGGGWTGDGYRWM